MKATDFDFKGSTQEVKNENRDRVLADIREKLPYKTVMAQKGKFGKEGNTFNPDMFASKDILKPVELDYVLNMNEQWRNGGLWYKVDYKASEKWNKEHKSQLEERKEAAQLEKDTNSKVKEALKDLGKK